MEELDQELRALKARFLGAQTVRPGQDQDLPLLGGPLSATLRKYLSKRVRVVWNAIRRDPVVLAVPFNTFAEPMLHTLSVVGGPSLPSISATSLAARCRTAYKTISQWKFWFSAIRQAAEEHLPWWPVVSKDMLSPAHWNMPPLVSFLAEAA